METLIQAIVEQQRVMSETINHMARADSGGEGLASSIAAENVLLNRTMMMEKFTMQFRSEDRDKDAFAWPDWKFKLRNHSAMVDPQYIVVDGRNRRRQE